MVQSAFGQVQKNFIVLLMHILLVTKVALSSSGGAENLIRVLCQGLVDKGHQVTVLSFDPNQESARHENSTINLINHAPSLYRLSPYNRWNMTIEALGTDPADRSLEIFLDLVDQKDFDVVNTHQLHGINRGIWRAAAERGLPVVHTIHDYYLLCPQGSMYRGNRRCAKQCWFCRIWSRNNKSFSRNVRAIGAPSQYVLDKHVNHGFFTHSYARVIRVASIHRGFTPRQTLRPHSPLRLGFIGRLHRVKGLEKLLAMLRASAMPSYELYIAGAGNEHYTAFLKESAAGLPIKWMGWLDRETFFPEIDVLVVPSLWDEPGGMVISEAMHYGVPALASDRGGLGEWEIGEEHQLVYLFDPDCRSSFRSALDRAITSLGNEKKLSSRKHPGYVEDLVDSYEALFRKAVGAQQSRGTRCSPSPAVPSDPRRPLP
jgi:glycosyltransferase involved in cell wall biosynthesis